MEHTRLDSLLSGLISIILPKTARLIFQLLLDRFAGRSKGDGMCLRDEVSRADLVRKDET